MQIFFDWCILTCCEALLDLVLCDRFFKKCTSFSINSCYSLFRCLLGEREWTRKGAGWKPACAQQWLKFYVSLCRSMHVPLCCVYFERTVADQNRISFWLFPSEAELHLVNTELFMLSVWDWEPGLISGFWLSFPLLVPYSVWLVPSTACSFLFVCLLGFPMLSKYLIIWFCK